MEKNDRIPFRHILLFCLRLSYRNSQQQGVLDSDKPVSECFNLLDYALPIRVSLASTNFSTALKRIQTFK